METILAHTTSADNQETAQQPDTLRLQFEDADFLPAPASIAHERAQLSQGMQEIYSEIQFVRVQYIAEEAHKLQLYDTKLKKFFYRQRIIQGKLADTPFLK